MTITYFEPLARAWQRMARMLFQPFRIEAWLTLGLAAFLSELGHWPGGGGGGGGQGRVGLKDGHGMRWLLDECARDVHGFLQIPWVLPMLGALIAALVVLSVLVAWLSARGRFVLLSAVATGRPEFLEPWRRTARLGNSLFLFLLALGFVTLGMLLLLLAGPFAVTVSAVVHDGVFRAPELAAVLLPLLLAVPVLVLMALVHAITVQLVMPVMLRQNVGVLEGWRRLMSLMGQHVGHFVAALLLMFVLSVAIGIGVVIVGFATCCIGFVILAIPYLGDVIQLPIHLTFRAFGAEFLAQFGPEWDVFQPDGPDAERPLP